MTEFYAGLLITLLDRESGKTVQHYAYPVVGVELIGFYGNAKRGFSVGPDGTWIEAQTERAPERCPCGCGLLV